MADHRASRPLAAAALVAVTAGTLLAAGPGRGDGGGRAGGGSSSAAGDADPGPATATDLCVAYVGATRADDNFLADSTPENAAALQGALGDLVDVGGRTDLTARQRAGLGLVVDGIRTASAVDVDVPSPDPAVASVPFAQASTAFARYLDTHCEAQLARPGVPEVTPS